MRRNPTTKRPNPALTSAAPTFAIFSFSSIQDSAFAMQRPCVWHWRTPQFTGNHIVDLYTLKMLKPELFTAARGKYQTTSLRKLLLMKNPIPPLDCLWNAAIHTSTVHPQLVHDAKRAAGLPVQPTEYFEIPVDKLKGFPVCIYYLPPPGLVMKLRIAWNAVMYWLGCTSLLSHTGYERLDLDNWLSLPSMPEDTVRCYEQWASEMRAGGSPQVLTYQSVPHVFVKGAIPVEGLSIIKCE